MMNLADPELELIDPTPNVHSMFLNFDQTFFESKLSSRCIVKWSKRMYSCAGTTSYEGRGGLCTVALSEPLLKLRPRKDLVETLLHEMIHAYLFVTNKDQDRDGHGPNFQAHMHRINRATGLNIKIYHEFYAEVELYRIHWWRCTGRCQFQRPYFGMVRRSNNRAPGPSDHWWKLHQKRCGGTFIKIKQPERPEKENNKNNIKSKPKADITQYIINNNNNVKRASNKNFIEDNKSNTSVLKDSINTYVKPKKETKIQSNGGKVIIPIKRPICNPEVTKPIPIGIQATGVDIGKGKTNNSVIATVRSVWGNKQINTLQTEELSKDTNNRSTPVKHKADNHIETPPFKMKKIDDYFKTSATSVLKNIYGQDFDITQSKSDEKIKVVPKISNPVDCPVCYSKIDSSEINKHLDECLNKDLIGKLANEGVVVKNQSKVDCDPNDKIKSEKIVGIEVIKSNLEKEIERHNKSKEVFETTNKENFNKKTAIKITTKRIDNNGKRKRTRTSSDIVDLRPTEKMRSDEKKKITDIRKSDSFMGPTSTTIPDTKPITLNPPIEAKPGSSKSDSTSDMACLCCGKKLIKYIGDHLDECTSFLGNNTTIPVEGASTSYAGEIININDDDKFDETQTFNTTGTKYPCPCCLQMVEQANMNNHLEECLS